MNDQSSGDGHDGVERRTILKAAAAGAGVATLAGCVGEEPGGGGGGDGNETESETVVPPRPTPGDTSQLDPVERFIVESLDYQNRLLEREYQ